MKFYFAPMEGITNYVYRNIHHACFGHVDKYFAPFLVTKFDQPITKKDLRDVLWERNQGIPLIPQILSNRPEDFLRMAEALAAIGYEEVNLNLGCPSRTVVTKRRGAGFLQDTEALDRFFDAVFASIKIKVSVKTRAGVEAHEELQKLMEVYNRYPLEELIIHPRVQTDYYKNTPNLQAFSDAQRESKNPVCYNGDITSVDRYSEFADTFPAVERIMAGRGILSNPCLFGELNAAEVLTKEKLRMFHDRLYEAYQNVLSGEKTVLFKMKELWFYFMDAFEDSEKRIKKIRKTEGLRTYEEYVKRIFEEKELKRK